MIGFQVFEIRRTNYNTYGVKMNDQMNSEQNRILRGPCKDDP